MQKHMIIPVFVPHKGCPFDCIYCNQKIISGQTDEVNAEKVITEVNEYLKLSSDKTHIEIGFYGGSFTGIDKDEQIKLLKAAYSFVASGKVQGIRLSTRPDYITREILEYLRLYGVTTIELGVQSLDNDVLNKSCRGHSASDVITSSHLIKEYGFSLGIQTMIGLPGDSKEKDLSTAHGVIELKSEIVRIYPVLVIRNTYLEKLFYRDEYMPLSLECAVDICTELLELYEKHDINVIRIGLQPTENISEGADVVAGPFHPAFRQLVEARRMLQRVIRVIEMEKMHNKSEIKIYTSSKDMSSIIGQKKQNIIHLKDKFGFVDIKVMLDNQIKEPFIIV